MRVFKNAAFSRYAQKENIGNDELLEIVDLLEKGVYNANLGGNVYKMRVVGKGKGKLGGFRVLVFFKREQRTFFAHGFAKNVMVNIKEKTLLKLKQQAKTLFEYTDDQIEIALKEGILEEI